MAREEVKEAAIRVDQWITYLASPWPFLVGSFGIDAGSLMKMESNRNDVSRETGEETSEEKRVYTQKERVLRMNDALFLINEHVSFLKADFSLPLDQDAVQT